MNIIKDCLIKNLPNKPFKYEFIENEYILIHSHSLMLLYDLNGNFITKFLRHSNGVKGLLNKITNEYFAFGQDIYDQNWNKLSKKLKASKKSVEKYNFTYKPKFIKSEKLIVAGFQRGVIGYYDNDLKVLNHIELEKDEHLIEILPNLNKAFTYSEKRGLIIQYNFPDFIKENEYKIGKQNRETIITKDYIFNYGYTSSNFLVSLKDGKTNRIQFHLTRKKGYKEQYIGPHNFGTSWIGVNMNNNKELLVCTHQSKSLIYNLSTKKSIELEAYKHLGFDRFRESHKDKHMYRGFFKDDYIYSNFGTKFILWNKKGEPITIQENIDDINIDPSGQTYSLTDGNLYKTYLEK